jgi:hypothetical protein
MDLQENLAPRIHMFSSLLYCAAALRDGVNLGAIGLCNEDENSDIYRVVPKLSFSNSGSIIFKVGKL